MNLTRRIGWLILLLPLEVFAQTSWKGTTSTAWNDAANWTAGVPTASLDVIIGDANFTGPNQPSVNANSACKSLTVGTGSKVCTLTVNKKIAVGGNVLIGANGTIDHSANQAISLTGNWINNGTYIASQPGSPITFAGTTQSLSGATTFRKVNINAGSTTTLNTNIVVNNQLTVNGTLEPGISPTFTVSGSGKLTVGTGTLRVRASTFAGNYALTGARTLNVGSTVDYASSANQTVDNSLTYRTLRISGGGTKTLAGNLPALGAATTTDGNLYVAAGTLDLSSFTANRGTPVGGTLTVANGATLKIGGVNSFPANYGTHSLVAGSTVEYNGANQTVTAETYGDLVLSSSGGAAMKTMPASAFTVTGNFSSVIGNGSSASFTAGAAITVNGNVTLGGGTTFNGGAFAHSVGANWTNNGAFNGGSGTMTLSGLAATITGSGSNNFNNLTITGAGVTATTNTDLNVSGNFAVTGAGTFTHQTGGTGKVTLSGASKNVSGSGIIFNNLTASGSISTTTSFTVAGNLAVNGSLAAAAGTITLSGSGKTISGTGAIAFSGLTVTGSLSTTNNFSIGADFAVSGSFSATAGTATFNGTSILSGTANLFNVTVSGTRLQVGAAATLGVAGTFTLGGTFDATTTAPNTVNYNGAGAQTVVATTYDNLTLSGSGTKTAAGAVTVNDDLTIASGVTLSGGAFTHSLYGNWINNGGFTPNSGTLQMLGSRDVSISGATTFNVLTLNKSSAANVVTLNGNVSVATLNMTGGAMNTTINAVTITTTRTGGGIILGTITRTHAFANGTAYAFEGTNNTITFSAGAGGISSITVIVAVGAVGDFPFGGSVNRQYTLGLSGSGAYSAALRLHYQDPELNGNTESTMQLWRNGGASWAASGKTANDAVNNWVEQNSLTNLAGRWTFSDNNSVVRWNGSVSTAWETAANWTSVQGSPSFPPSSNDIVELGTVAFVNQPTINSAAGAKSILFGSAQAVTLTLGASSSLITAGNIDGLWTNNAAHTIAVGAQTLAVGGDLILSDGTSGQTIQLTASTGTISISGSLIESGGANVTFTGAGVLKIGVDYSYASGTFTPGASIVIYNGAAAQIVAPVTYNRLAFEKTGGTATLSFPATVNGDLTLTNAGTFLISASLTVGGSVVIGAGTTFTMSGGGTTLAVGGDWTRLGTFTPGSATTLFNGSGAQSIGTSLFNNLTVNKSSGAATLAGNLSFNGDLNLAAGTLDLAGFTANRGAVGGTLTLAANATLKVGGSFPANFGARNVAVNSTVIYNGSSLQTISAETYGCLLLSNGGGNAKSLAGATTVAGDLTINSTASLWAGAFSLTAQGNWTNNGTFTPQTGTVTLAGSGKTLSGATTFNHLTVSGSYIAASGITVNGTMTVSGSYDAANTTNTFARDFLNSGTFTSGGVVTFTGAAAQTLALNGGFNSSGTVNFNGTVTPVFGGLSAPVLWNVNVNNTAGIAPILNWTIGGDFVVANGASFNGGAMTHTFSGNFTNNGTVTSSGGLIFAPASAVTLSLRGTAFTSTGNVIFGGTGPITMAGGAPTFANVEIANTHAAGVTPSVNWTVNGNVLVDVGATFNGGSSVTHTVAGDFSVNGTFGGGASIVNLTGTSQIAGAGAITFNHLTISGTITVGTDIGVSGNLTNNGTIDSTGVDLNFTGSGPSIIAGSTTPTTIDSLVVAKTSATVTLAVNVGSLSALTISSGTLDASTFTLTEVVGGVLTANAGGTLKIGGSNPLPTFDTYSFDPASTVEFAGTGAQTIAAQNYGNLTSSSTGARTLISSGTIGIAGTFTPGANSYTIAGSTIAYNGSGAQTITTFNYQNLASSSTGARTLPSSGTIGVAGTFTPGANSFTVTGSTMNFNGAAQTIPAFTFGNLTTSGSGTKTLGGNATVSGNLNLSAGTLADAGFTLTLNADAANAVTHGGTGKVLLSGGTTNHVLSGVGTYQNFELSDMNGALLSAANLTVNGTLTLTAGALATSTNKVIVSTGGSVSRTNGQVNGWLQKNVATSPTTRTFEVGDGTNYAPVSVTFGNVTTAGNLIASTTAGDHPDVANSGIAATRSANRYWTLTNNGVAFNNYSATFQFAPSDVDAGADPLNFVVARKNAGAWSLPTILSRSMTNIQAGSLTAFGEFEVGQSASVPDIATQPQSQRVNLGSNVTFTVTATGASPLAYQWRFNGTNISGATNTSYSIASVSDANAGNYSVVVTNANGSDISSNALLTVNHAPSMAAIADGTVCPGNLLSVPTSVTDPDGGVFTYALLAAPTGAAIDTNGVITWTPTIAEASSTNTITAQVTDDGSPGLTSMQSFTVTVSVPVSATPLASLTNCPGTTAVFTTTPSGSGPFSFVWRKDGNLISGATTNSFATNNVTAGSAGIYTVEVTGACGSVTNSAALAVNATPIITGQPLDATNTVGQSVSFSVTATGVGLTYQWRQATVNISGATNSSYSIGAVLTTDAGGYDCIVAGACGLSATSSVATLTVNKAGTVSVVTSAANPALPGANVTFTATLSVIAPGSGIPTGNVTFKEGASTLGTGSLDSSAMATLTINSLSHGAHTITAEYAGDANFIGSTNSVNQLIDTRPSPGGDTLQRYTTSGAKVRVATLLANDTDADAEALTFNSVSAASAQGGTVVTNGPWVFYTPLAGFTNADAFTYVIGDTLGLQATGSVSVAIIVDNDPSQNLVAIQDLGNNASRLEFQGIAGRTYTIQYTENLGAPNWQPLGAATADSTGWFEFTDAPGPAAPARFYRTTYP